MPPTRANLDTLMVRKLGGKLAFVNKSVVTDGTNPDLNYPIANAIALLGGTVADYSAVADADIATVPAVKLPSLFGLTELYALEDIWGCMTDVTETAVTRTQSWSLMSSEIVTRIAQLQQLYKSLLMIYRPLKTGTIRVPSVQRACDPEM